jgi:hypothetical protein
VVIHEIHYHPPSSAGRGLEFLELHNPDAEPVSLAGWRLEGGLEFTFPEGAVIPPRGYAVLCKDCALLEQSFPRLGSGWFGSYEGSLDNAGESLELVDPFNAVVDSVTYDDELPWPEGADGAGGSLQRLCPSAPAWDPQNWFAGALTPNAPNRDSLCPPPPHVSPPVVITEILYHPPPDGVTHPSVEDGEDEEFVELHNTTGNAIDLTGWSFGEAIDFTFPRLSIPPGGYLVVARDAALWRAAGVENVVGDFTGRLSNGGERVALLDEDGDHVDSVNYADAGEWPYGPDGTGRSLEKVAVLSAASDPANWRTSALAPSAQFRRLAGEGPLGQGLTQRLLIYIDGEGEIVVVNLLENGNFDAGIESWMPAGTMSGSVFAPGQGAGGSGGLRLVSTGPCPSGGECGTAFSVSTRLPGGLSRDHVYRVSLDWRYVRGSSRLRAGLVRGAGVRLEPPTPGRANNLTVAEAPLYISNENRFPREPRSTDPVWITARVRGKANPDVTLTYYLAGNAGVAVAMRDDGLHRDGPAGDGVFGAELPPFPANTPVPYRITAAAGGDRVEYPQPLDVGVFNLAEASGYYVNDLQPDSVLPTYTFILPGLANNEWETLQQYLNCTNPVPGSFASRGDLFSNVGVRFRGNTACAELFKKKNLKVFFNRGRHLDGLGKMNFNGMWTDKALVREHLSWDFVRQVGAPYFETRYVRIHINGAYHGLFLYVEHHGDDYLERNGLDGGGNLYKAREPLTANPRGVENHATQAGFQAAWEKETNEESDYADVLEFVNAMHADSRTAGGPTAAFYQNRTFEEMLIGYQLTQAVLNNVDSFPKNHFLYHDLVNDRWGMTSWDLDLTFGKFFDPSVFPVGTLNDVMSSDVGFDLNPWFGATVLGNPLLHFLVDFFLRSGRGHYQRAYLSRLWDLLEEKYRNEEYDPRLDALLEFLEDEEAEDHARWGRYVSNVPGHADDMKSNIETVKRQIRLHRDFLREYIQVVHAQIPRAPRVKITEVMYWPEGGADGLEFLEFQNTSGAELDISGWKTTGITFTFPPGTVIPADGVFLLSRSPPQFRQRYGERPFLFGPYDGKLANEGEELRLLDAGPGHPATIDYLHYNEDAPWPEVKPGQSLELTGVAPDRDNDVPEYWVASTALGGTPGTAEPRFIRGEVDQNGTVGLTDAIVTLNYLFLSGAAPACLDAADANDDGKVDITDPIYLLKHLFLSGTAPPAPYPLAGPDPTADTVDC